MFLLSLPQALCALKFKLKPPAWYEPYIQFPLIRPSYNQTLGTLYKESCKVDNRS